MERLRTKKKLIVLMCITAFMLGCSDSVYNQSVNEKHNVGLNHSELDPYVIKTINTDINNAPPAAGGKNYYVCDNGDDGNSGTSEFSPFKTVTRGLIEFNRMSAGTSVLFCRGAEFEVSTATRLYNKNCNTESLCTIGSYGAGDRPVINARGLGSYAVFNFQDGGAPSKDGGYVLEDLMLLSDGTSAYGVTLWNDVDDVMIRNLHIQGFEVAVSSGTSNPIASSDVNGINDRITLKNSVIRGNSRQGLLLTCNDCLVEGNTFINNGFSEAKFNHNIYLSSTNNITIRGNYLYQSAIVNGKCEGVSLVGHGHMTNVLIENNVIEEDSGAVGGGCWGIAIDAGYNYEESFIGLVIRNNKIINVGGQAIGCSSCVDVVIEGNTIYDSAGTLWSGGIVVPNRKEDILKSSNVIISGNEILSSGGGSSGIVIGGESVFTVVNNIIQLPFNAYVDCVARKEANINTNVSSNECSKGSPLPSLDSVKGINVEPTPARTRTRTPADSNLSGSAPKSSAPKSSGSRRSGSRRSSSSETSSSETSSSETSSAETENVAGSKVMKVVQKKGTYRRKCRATSSDGRCLMN